ncbi:MAG: DUF2202 domain-containing protein [Chlorobi bacterium]|nr:DUF2202 domain-containing protein [Chlorobiota bacterium]
MVKKQTWIWVLAALVLGMSACKTKGPEPVTLSDDEVEMLKYMREEEKLARDVYSYLFTEWGTFIFANIAQSEERHMAMVKVLLDQYGIEDPALDEPGRFSNSQIQALYDQLIAQGSQSEMDALIVGATIEDLDIYDLEHYMSQTDNQDILTVFSNLECGSRNHLRSFYREIINRGGDYSPQYISQEEFESIVNTPHEHCGG